MINFCPTCIAAGFTPFSLIISSIVTSKFWAILPIESPAWTIYSTGSVRISGRLCGASGVGDAKGLTAEGSSGMSTTGVSTAVGSGATGVAGVVGDGVFQEAPASVAVDCTRAVGVGVFQGAPVEMVQAKMVKTRMAVMKPYV